MLGLDQLDEEDDDHLCIKCGSTIIGLDNYIRHRKSGCGKQISKNESFQSLKERNLGADVFFQSLELQSRPTMQDVMLPQTSKSLSAGVLTRRATAAIIATKDIDNSSIVSTKRGQDWIGGHSLKVAEHEDNQTKLIKAVANISGTVKKETTNRPLAILDDFKHEDDSNEESDDSEELDIDEHPHTGGKWKPSANYTGGKWKPSYGGRDPSSHWNSTFTPEPDQLEESEDEHTGGKWKPISHVPSVKMVEAEYEEEDAFMPPPGHTKGKWIPGAKDDHKAQIMDATALHKEGKPVQYWCGPCNRRLGSRIIYEKHLTSKFHLKRTLPEKDLEYSGTFKNDRIEGKTSKRIIKPSSYLKGFYVIPKKPVKKSKIIKPESKSIVKRRKRNPTFVYCMVCHHRVKPFLLGKHLISHYHFRKEDLNDEISKTQILDNIDKIVRQSPFQCSPCKFYANWQAEFMRHWRTDTHKQNMANFDGRYWCSFCKFECNTPGQIYGHLVGDEHQEVVAAINRSIPIIIRKKKSIKCDNCSKEFRFNVQLRRHSKFLCPMIDTSTASDTYQGRKNCNQCTFTCKTKMGLARHVNKKHHMKLYYCTVCSMQFPNIAEIKKHRSLQSHRIKQKELRKEKGFEVKELTKSCPHCDAPKFKNIIYLKKHIQEKHKDACSSCYRCGKKFALPQEVSWHLRMKGCVFDEENTPSTSTTTKQLWTCRFCTFSNESHAECIFHEVLVHGEPLDSKKKLNCPVCRKAYEAYSLRSHLRMHTNERPFVCKICSLSFFRRSSLIFHEKLKHWKKLEEAKKPKIDPKVCASVTKESALPKHFLCATCGASFNRKYNLQQHVTRHTGRKYPCSHEGCLYLSRNVSELKTHALIHSEERAYKCDQCSYAAKTNVQLNKHKKTHSSSHKKLECPVCKYKVAEPARMIRHQRTHTEQKPFKCRYCSHTSSTLENLRKHILSTSAHVNKYIYECEFCTEETFRTNYAKELKIHLMQNHSDEFSDKKLITTYVTEYLMDTRERPQNKQETKTDENLEFNLSNGCETKPFIQDESIILELGEGCYSVTENGSLVPYLQE